MTTPETVRRIGYCCKTVIPESASDTLDHNFKSTTLSYLNKLTPEGVQEKLWSIIQHNLRAMGSVLQRLSRFPVDVRMFRIGSDLLPMWDHPIAVATYSDTEVRRYVEANLAAIGDLARRWDIRLSFHPDQFVVIASPTEGVADRGIAALEKVAEIVGLMGYEGWHDGGFAINIHAGAASVTTDQLRDVITNRLSPQARNFLTLENDEFSHGLVQLAELKDVVAIVPDLHHVWISEGAYLNPYANILHDVQESWRGVRPKLHLAMSRQHLIPEPFCNRPLINMSSLIEEGLTKTKLRAHSDSPWHTGILNYARQFNDRFDIMWEGKDKNLGQQIIKNHFNENNNDRTR